MKLTSISLKNFRRLESTQIDFENDDTVFVGPNNSGKTSATVAFRLFLDTKSDFKVHDFSVSRISDLNAFGESTSVDDDNSKLPSIEMNLWFSIDPEIEFGRVFSLLPNVSESFEEVGISIKYSVKDSRKLMSDYLSAFPRGTDGKSKMNLAHYLSLQGNLNRHFGLTYFALDKTSGAETEHPIEPDEGRRVLQSLIRVDFVDAQRNIDDQETSRSNRLSSAFAAFYKKNLEQATTSEEANKIIDVNNQNLTKHYETHFKELMGVIGQLGVPSVNDRKLKIISSLNAEEALRGNTELRYFDPILNHELPEAYNGLGFKNLVYMAIQISHFHIQWMRTEENRPLCQLIFIEEPEVHLHAQVQQTFASNIWKIIHNAAKAAGEVSMVPQLAITTHSSHILDAVDFSKVRYFRRCKLEHEKETEVITYNASKVKSLKKFQPDKKSAGATEADPEETLRFLKRYLKLTHCDLFFADAAILVEGTVEKLLLPRMIEKSAPNLALNYLTILEVGGAYAHRFSSLFEFLGIPFLVITDIDSVDPSDGRKACRADKHNANSSNASLAFFLKKNKVSELVNLKTEEQILTEKLCFIAYQKQTQVTEFKSPGLMHGRTFEETFVYENLALFRAEKIRLGSKLPIEEDFEKQYESIYQHVRSSDFKKTEFALDVASSTEAWRTPKYIADGLNWISQQLKVEPPAIA